MCHSDINIALSLEVVKHATPASDPHALFRLILSVQRDAMLSSMHRFRVSSTVRPLMTVKYVDRVSGSRTTQGILRLKRDVLTRCI